MVNGVSVSTVGTRPAHAIIPEKSRFPCISHVKIQATDR
jgi:hypothetical protein